MNHYTLLHSMAEKYTKNTSTSKITDQLSATASSIYVAHYEMGKISTFILLSKETIMVLVIFLVSVDFLVQKKMLCVHSALCGYSEDIHFFLQI